MAKFQYRMQSILDLQVKLEQQDRIQYGLMNRRLREEEEKLQALALKRVAYENRDRELRMGKINIRDITDNKKSIDAIKVLIRNQMMEIHRAQKDVEAARKKLIDTMQNRKMHEKLREKAFEEFKLELEYAEKKEVDELVSYNYNQTDGI